MTQDDKDSPKQIQTSTLSDFQALDRWLESVFLSESPETKRLEVLAHIEQVAPHLSARFLALLDVDEETMLSWEDGQFQLFGKTIELNPGDKLGTWEVVREIGRGGMGLVYEVQRAHTISEGQFFQRGALKLVMGATPVMMSGGPHDRFLREMATLSSLAEHPNIAQFLDAGTTKDSPRIPYFVMEHIEGVHLDVYCDEQKLSLRDRLSLLIDVINAVHFMHQRGVIHRDLKPPNILVTPQGHCKILDMGIAQTSNAQNTLAFTPSWASPEQIEGRPVTVASDVYNLGLLLLLLVWGSHVDTDTTITLRTRWQSLAPEMRERRALSRGCEASQWKSQLSMELNAIVSKSLSASAADRYDSALDLARDIENLLEGRPVMALEHQSGYATFYFARRYKWVWAVMFGVLMIFGFWSISLVQKNQAIQTASRQATTSSRLAKMEAERSQTLASFMEKMLIQSNPHAAGERGRTVEDVLNHSARALMDRKQLVHSKPVTATLLRVMAESYLGMGLPKKARPLIERALELTPLPSSLICVSTGSQLEHARLALAHGDLLRQSGQPKEALARWHKTLTQCSLAKATNQQEDVRIQLHLRIGWLHLFAIVNNKKAKFHYDKALEFSQAGHHMTHTEGQIRALVGLSIVDSNYPDRHANSTRRVSMALKLADTLWHKKHPQRAQFYHELSFGEPVPEKRLAWRLASLDIYEHVYGKDHLFVGRVLNDLSLSIENTQRAKSLALMERAFKIFQKHVPEDHNERQSVGNNLASMLVVMGDLKRAAIILERNASLDKTPTTMSNLAQLRMAQGRYAEAIEINKAILEKMVMTPGSKDVRHAILYQRLVLGYELNKQPKKADAYLAHQWTSLLPSWIKDIGLLEFYAKLHIQRAIQKGRQSIGRPK